MACLSREKGGYRNVTDVLTLGGEGGSDYRPIRKAKSFDHGVKPMKSSGSCDE